MEAVPRMPMLSFELKHSPEPVEFGPTLKQIIRDRYNEDPANYNKACTDLEQLRQNAVQVTHDFVGCSTLKKYYAQLQFLQSRFPLHEVAEPTIAFTWEDVQSGREYSHSDIKFEQASILYNIGSLHSILGAMDTRQSPEGMKVSCTHFQCAAWSFQHLRDHFGSSGMSPDMAHEILSFHIDLMLAQAQECILEKSMTDNRKSSITAKVAVQIVEFYRQALRNLDSTNSEGLISSRRYKDWKRRIEIKIMFYQMIMFFYLGNQSEDQQKHGERLAYFSAANEKLSQCSKLAKNEVPEIHESLRFTLDVVGGKYNSAKKDNDFVYHEKVPSLDTLPDIKGASLVKGIPFNPNDPEVSGVDIFHKLVPMEAHESSSLYSEEKAVLLRNVGGEVEEKNQELVEYMASLQLDQSKLTAEPERLPQALLEKCAAISVRPNAIKGLVDSMGGVSGLSTEVGLGIKEIIEMLDLEDTEEQEFQKTFGKRSTTIILPEIRKECGICDEQHKRGEQSNMELHKAMNTHITNLRLISGPLDELQKSLPSTELAKSTEDENIVAELQRLMGKVEEMKAQRQTLFDQFRNEVHKDDITNAIVTHEGMDKQTFFKEQLKKHDEVVGFLKQNMGAQEKILKALTETNARYASIRRNTGESVALREAKIAELISSYDVYEDLMAKSQKGFEFYKKLNTNVTRLFKRTKGVVKSNGEERQQIKKRYAPKAPPPSRPMAPKPGQSPTMPLPPTTSQSALPSFDGPKLKDYLPFMKPATFGTKKGSTAPPDVQPQASHGNLDFPDASGLPDLPGDIGGLLPGGLLSGFPGSGSSYPEVPGFLTADGGIPGGNYAGQYPTAPLHRSPSPSLQPQGYPDGVQSHSQIPDVRVPTGVPPGAVQGIRPQQQQQLPQLQQQPQQPLPVLPAGYSFIDQMTNNSSEEMHRQPLTNPRIRPKYDTTSTVSSVDTPIISPTKDTNNVDGHSVHTHNVRHPLGVRGVQYVPGGPFPNQQLPTQHPGYPIYPPGPGQVPHHHSSLPHNPVQTAPIPPGTGPFGHPQFPTGGQGPVNVHTQTGNQAPYAQKQPLQQQQQHSHLPQHAGQIGIPRGQLPTGNPQGSTYAPQFSPVQPDRPAGQTMPASQYGVSGPQTIQQAPIPHSAQNIPGSLYGQHASQVPAAAPVPGNFSQNVPQNVSQISYSQPPSQSAMGQQPLNQQQNMGQQGYQQHPQGAGLGSTSQSGQTAFVGQTSYSGGMLPSSQPQAANQQQYVHTSVSQPYSQQSTSSSSFQSQNSASQYVPDQAVSQHQPQNTSIAYQQPQFQQNQPREQALGQQQYSGQQQCNQQLPPNFQQNPRLPSTVPNQFLLQGRTPVSNQQISSVHSGHQPGVQQGYQPPIVPSAQQQQPLSQGQQQPGQQLSFPHGQQQPVLQGQQQPVLQRQQQPVLQGQQQPVFPAQQQAGALAGQSLQTVPPTNQSMYPPALSQTGAPQGVYQTGVQQQQQQRQQPVTQKAPQQQQGFQPEPPTPQIPCAGTFGQPLPYNQTSVPGQVPVSGGHAPINKPPIQQSQNPLAAQAHGHATTGVLQQPVMPQGSNVHGQHGQQPSQSFSQQPQAGGIGYPYSAQLNPGSATPMPTQATASVTAPKLNVWPEQARTQHPQPAVQQLYGSNQQQQQQQHIPVSGQQNFAIQQPFNPVAPGVVAQQPHNINIQGYATVGQQNVASQGMPVLQPTAYQPPASKQLQPNVVGQQPLHPASVGMQNQPSTSKTSLTPVKPVTTVVAASIPAAPVLGTQPVTVKPDAKSTSLAPCTQPVMAARVPSPLNRQLSSSTTSSLDDMLSSSPENLRGDVCAPDPVLTPKVMTAQEIQQQKEEAAMKLDSLRHHPKDPYDDPDTLNKFVIEVEKFEKFVDHLCKPKLSGPSQLDTDWKEMGEQQERDSKLSSMAVARCYVIKNRDHDVMPYDAARVLLTSGKDDYINASWMDDLVLSCPKFIATQAPLSVTLVDFWLMVCEQGTEVIVMLAKEDDPGKGKEAIVMLAKEDSPGKKIPVYWPTEKGHVIQHGPISLNLQSVKNKQLWIERIIYLTNTETKQGRTIVHLQYTGWSVSGLPEKIPYILQFINEVQFFYKQQRSLLKPVIVHCSNGVGRTGTFIAIYTGMQEINKGSGIMDIPSLIMKMRAKRKHMVTEKEHLKFCYDAILYHAQDVLIKRGILTNKKSFSDKLPSPGDKSHIRKPSEDFILGTGIGLHTLESNVSKFTSKNTMGQERETIKGGGDQVITNSSQTTISVISTDSVKSSDTVLPKEQLTNQSLPDLLQRQPTANESSRTIDSGGGSNVDMLSGLADKSSPRSGSEGQIRVDNVPSELMSSGTQSLGASPHHKQSQLHDQFSSLPPSLADLQNPHTFTLDPSTGRKRISKSSFTQKMPGLTDSMNVDPTDPLSSLDPLWTIHKAEKSGESVKSS